MDNTQDLISIVMSAFQETPAVARRAVESIFAQTYSHWELIVVVEAQARPDMAAELRVLAGEDSRIHLIFNKSRMGFPESLNLGVRAARGKYVARMDCDDESLPNRLAEQHAYLCKCSEVDVLGSALVYTTGEKTLLERCYDRDVTRCIRRFNPMAHPTVIMRRNLFEKYGFYQANEKIEDYDLWIRWHAAGVRFDNLPRILYRYYQSESNSKNLATRQQLRNTILLKWKHRHLLKLDPFDFLYLLAEACLSLLPARLIVALFYFVRRRSQRRAPPHQNP